MQSIPRNNMWRLYYVIPRNIKSCATQMRLTRDIKEAITFIHCHSTMPKLTLKQTKKITISTDGQVLATTNKKTSYGSVTTIHRINKPDQKMIKFIEESHKKGDDNIFRMLEDSTVGSNQGLLDSSHTRVHGVKGVPKLIQNVIDLTEL